jgi:hypothetical protein
LAPKGVLFPDKKTSESRVDFDMPRSYPNAGGAANTAHGTAHRRMGKSGMAGGSEVKATTTDQIRLKNYRDSLKIKHERELQDMDQEHRERLANSIERNENQSKDIEHAYDVMISNEAKLLEEKLETVRHDNERRLEDEIDLGKNEIEKVRLRSQARIEQIEKETEERVAKAQEELRTKIKSLTEQEQAEERKFARRADVRDSRGKEKAREKGSA